MKPRTTQPLTLAQWLALLSAEYLPASYVQARRTDLEELWELGASPGCASTYCRAHLMAPRLEGDTYTGPTHAAPVLDEGMH